MPSDPRIDAYIAAQAEFARPILTHLRAAVHRACPGVEETIKWSMPFFTWRGRTLCSMAAFKAHAAFGFWQGREVAGEARRDGAMGQLGRITSLADLPLDAELEAMIASAAALIEAGGPPRRSAQAPKPELALPDDLATALAADPAAQACYDGFPPGARREYLEWVLDAKQSATRARRIAQAVEWLAEGKRRNWKYERS